MSIDAEITALIATTDAEITTASSPLSIAPDMVGSAIDNLALIVKKYYGQTFSIIGGAGVPNDADGQDQWIYIRDNNPAEFYIKVAGTWGSPLAQINWGVTFPDGALIGLLTSISGFVVTVTAGGWTIDNVIYRKATQTQFTLSAADLNYGRYDLIYATTSNTVLIFTGTPSSSPVQPTLPANSVVLDYAFIPASSTGQSPYLLYGSNNNLAFGKYVITKDQDDLVATGFGDWYLELTDTDNNALPPNVMPYNIRSVQGSHTYPVNPFVEDDYSWNHPRIYGFPDKAITQAITILAQ